MKVRAIHRNARMSPRKIRPLARLLRGMPVREARHQLKFLPGKAPAIVEQVLHSAVANAVNNFELEESKLVVADVLINQGLVMKRSQPVSKGMAHPILKRSAHVMVVVDDQGKVKGAKPTKRKTNIEELSADEYSAQQAAQPAATQEITEKASEKNATPVRSVETSKDKTEYTAFQKTKMMQQGGDRKKSHRRKDA